MIKLEEIEVKLLIQMLAQSESSLAGAQAQFTQCLKVIY